MSLSFMTPAPALESPAKTKPAYTALTIFGLLIVACYAPAVRSLVRDWMTNEDMGHGFFVPVVAGYLLWQQRDQLAATPAKPNWWGLPIVLWGAAPCMMGTLRAEMFLARR